MKINQFSQVFIISLIISLGFFEKLPVAAFVTNSPENNSSLTTNNDSSGSSNLAEFLGATSQDSQKSTIDCNLTNKVQNYAGVPEPTLISGLFFVGGLGLWSGRKKIISYFR